MMTPNDALLLLIAEMRIQMADADGQRDAALARVAELEGRLVELEAERAMHGMS